jgi:hypothetical protein
MSTTDTQIKFASVTMVLFLGLAAMIAYAFRTNISANWEEKRCDPYVVPLAAFFKPEKDPRSPTQFARDNWSFCQKEYIQGAIRLAAAGAQDLADAEADVVSMTKGLIGVFADVFNDLWTFCHEAYSVFMDRMTGAAKLFHNMLIQLHNLVDRLQASIFSIIMALMSAMVAFINTVQFVLIVAIIVIGILLAMMIILFFVLLPISGLIVTVSAIAAVTVVVVATAIAASMVSGHCFTPDTRVSMAGGGGTRPIRDIRIGDVLVDGGRVTAVHRFHVPTELYNLYGVHVSGDHLVMHPDNSHRLIPVRNHPDVSRVHQSLVERIKGQELWCLTTTTRRIPVRSEQEGVILFADWEEIPEDREDTLEEWFIQVWYALNGTNDPVRFPSRSVLQSTAAISPDTRVGRRTWWGGTEWVRAADIQLGDTLSHGAGDVTGIVQMAPSEVRRGLSLSGATSDPPCIVSEAVWLRQGDKWHPPRGFYMTDGMPGKWIHFYTTNGIVPLGGEWIIRDASDVGCEQLRPIVDSVVLGATLRL